MRYKTLVKIGSKTFRSYPVGTYDECMRDAVQLILGYGGLAHPKTSATIQAEAEVGRWYTYSEVRVDKIDEAARLIAEGNPEPEHADMLTRRVWHQIKNWLTKPSPWKVL